jgi:4-amino-4-deoxy-L-arabinose transferase-like glycosyltransferase
MGKADINVFPNSMITIARIFNPTFFMIFFLLFLYSFLRFLHIEEMSESEGKRKWKLLCAIFLGISLYSQIYWGIYSFSTFIFFALIYFFFFKKKADKIRKGSRMDFAFRFCFMFTFFDF